MEPTAVLLLAFPVSRVEIRVRTFIIVVGATGLKLEHRAQCWGMKLLWKDEEVSSVFVYQ